jgi:hypothetical protein
MEPVVGDVPPRRGQWLEDPFSRRAVFALVALAAVGSGCSHPKSEATNAGSTTPSRSGGLTPATTTRPTFVGGTNTYLTTGILEANSEMYGGSWSGPWSYDSGGGSGVITADVDFDYRGRRVTAKCAIGGELMATAVLPFDIDFAVDSFTYEGDTKTFTVNHDRPLGRVTVTDDGGGGRFKLTMDSVSGHPDVAFVAVTGALNHPSLVPVQFSLTFSDGTTRTGTANFTMI